MNAGESEYGDDRGCQRKRTDSRRGGRKEQQQTAAENYGRRQRLRFDDYFLQAGVRLFFFVRIFGGFHRDQQANAIAARYDLDIDLGKLTPDPVDRFFRKDR